MSDPQTPKPALKRAVTGDTWVAEPATLYLDDVEAIYEVFKRAEAQDLTLRVDGWELDSPAEASQVKSTETRDLRIHSDRPYATFEAYPGGFRVYISDDGDLQLRGLRDAIREVVERRRLWVIRRWLPMYLLLVPSWLGIFVPKTLPLVIILWVVVMATGLSVFFAAAYVDRRNRRKRNTVTVLRHFTSKPSFRQANRDLLLVLITILGTLIATVLGGVILFALGLVGNSPQVTPGP